MNRADERAKPSAMVIPIFNMLLLVNEEDKTDSKMLSNEEQANFVRSQSSQDKVVIVRDQWSSKIEFLLAVIGFAVDLGNVWRFPYICYRNGGGAFLIPYMVMFFFGGLPLFFMELALGQYHRSGCISIWAKICPMFKGIGFGIFFITSYVACYYNSIISYAVFFFFNSFSWQVPWKTCGNPWNTDKCALSLNLSKNAAGEKLSSPAEEFFL